jgi:rare lipoprotein A
VACPESSNSQGESINVCPSRGVERREVMHQLMALRGGRHERLAGLLMAAVLLAVLTACSTPLNRDRAGSSGTPPSNRTAEPGELGRTAEPGELGRGKASWYGPGFQGKRTASGERFDMNQLTAAHRTLPFGTRVRVRNIKNGREVVVRINDRGPQIQSRIIDLSKAAAAELDLVRAGEAPVLLLEP